LLHDGQFANSRVSPTKTPELVATEGRRDREGKPEVVIEQYRPASHLQKELIE
jgi:hypothetical protein